MSGDKGNPTKDGQEAIDQGSFWPKVCRNAGHCMRGRVWIRARTDAWIVLPETGPEVIIGGRSRTKRPAQRLAKKRGFGSPQNQSISEGLTEKHKKQTFRNTKSTGEGLKGNKTREQSSQERGAGGKRVTIEMET